MKGKDEILSFLQERKEELFQEYGIVKIGLFGSFARDEGGVDSDIDLLVEFKPNTENLTEKKTRIKELVRQRFNRNVDLCREKYIKKYYKKEIIESVIYV